jgi:hypothetical protein
MAGRAVILFAHGARDARWSMTLGELQQRVLPVLSELPGMLDFIAGAVARGGD